LPKASWVILVIYDISDKQVVELVNVWRVELRHNVIFDGSALPLGVYIYHIEAGDFTASGMMYW
jgi:hypothetical protein